MGSDCAAGRQALETIFSSVSDHQELEHSEFPTLPVSTSCGNIAPGERPKRESDARS